jgi:hypothetical protein
MTIEDWERLAKAEGTRANRMEDDSRRLRHVLRDIRESINTALESGR